MQPTYKDTCRRVTYSVAVPGTFQMEREEGCVSYNTSEFIALAAVNSILGGVSLIACLMVIGLIFFLKKYLIFTQRLILYLTIAAALSSFGIVMQAATYFPDNNAYRVYCMVSAFFNQTTACSQLMAVCCITLDLFLTAVLQKKSRREWIFILVIFVLPLLFNWIPFIDSTYGEVGPWCWIRAVNANCTVHKFGLAMRIILWYGLLFPILAAVLVVYIIILVFSRHQVHKFQGKYDPDAQRQKQMMAEEIKPLLAYPIIFFFLHFFSLINQVYHIFNKEPLTALYWLEAIVTPLDGGIFALVYFLDKETRERLHWRKLKGECIKFCWTGEVKEYQLERVRTDSLHLPDYSTESYVSSDVLNMLNKL